MVSSAVIVFDGRITECYFWQCCSSVVTVGFRCFIFQLHGTILGIQWGTRLDRWADFFLGCVSPEMSFLFKSSATAWGRDDYFCLCTSWRTDWSTLPFGLEKGSCTWRYWLWISLRNSKNVYTLHFSGFHVPLWICTAKLFGVRFLGEVLLNLYIGDRWQLDWTKRKDVCHGWSVPL